MSRRRRISAIGIAGLLVSLCARTALGQVNVTLAWDAPADPSIAGYVVSYGTQSGRYSAALNVGRLTSARMSGLGSGTTYYFVVQSYNASGVLSVPTPELIYLTPSSFSDGPLVAGFDGIRAAYITELRARINALRARYGLAAYPYTDPVIVAGVTGPKAQHIVDLRTALAEAYNRARLPPPTYTAPGPAAGVSIRATHVTEIRNAVAAIE